jgi:uncharacterized protein (DUF1778 family)
MSTKSKRERLSIDVLPEEHKRIKAYAAMCGKTIKTFVLESIYQKIQKMEEEKDLQFMQAHPTQVLKDVWDNDEDSIYDDM